MSSIDKKSILIAIISVSFLISSSSLLPSKEGLENNSPNPYHSDSNSSPIHGHSFLNFTAPISHNSQINATWYAEVSVQESYGTELLDNRSLGLLVQIDSILGNSDGWIDVEESNEFAGLVASARNWTDAYSGGCCSFDYSSMQVSGERQLTVVPPETGPVNRSEGHWGWTESANLSGLSDGRVLRLLDLPRVGAMIEEVPISIGLPEGW